MSNVHQCSGGVLAFNIQFHIALASNQIKKITCSLIQLFDLPVSILQSDIFLLILNPMTDQ